MFTDPQSLTLAGAAKTLNRTKVGDENATYRTSDGVLTLRASHQTNRGRVRRMIRLDHKVVAADPITAVNQQVTAGLYLVVDVPSNMSYTTAQQEELQTAFINYLIANDSAVYKKLIGGES